MNRKKFYLREFNSILPVLLKSQILKGKYDGCFHDNFLKKRDLLNPRWQEAVLSLKFFYELGRKTLISRIEKGIKFWCLCQKLKPKYFQGQYLKGQ